MSSTPFRDVAVDVLLVLVQEHHVGLRGPFGEGADPAQDLVPDGLDREPSAR